MIKQLTKVSKLHKNEWRPIKNLADFCAEHDKYRIKLYPHIIQDRLTMEFNDFFYYVDGNLVGYLALFTFGADEAEMTAVVHPKYRHQGIWKKLLAEAILELRKRYISNCVWLCPRGSFVDQQFMENLLGKYLFSQAEMKAMREPVQKSLPEIKLRPTTTADLMLISQLGALSFNSSLADTLQRFTENMREKNRKIWLASSATHENIGKIHVRYEDTQTAFIHDLCIVPEHRHKNLGMAMILETMKLLQKTGHKTIILDVECHNQGAFKLYEQCGFVTMGIHDYWRIGVEIMTQKWG